MGLDRKFNGRIGTDGRVEIRLADKSVVRMFPIDARAALLHPHVHFADAVEPPDDGVVVLPLLQATPPESPDSGVVAPPAVPPVFEEAPVAEGDLASFFETADQF